VQGYVLRSPLAVGAFATVAATNVWLGATLLTAPRLGVALVLLPVLALAVGALIASNRAILVYLAIAFDLFSPLPLNGPLPMGGVYPSDLFVALAVGSWLAAWLINPPERRPRWVATPVLGLPLLLFTIALSAATLRGDLDRGVPLIGPSFRLVVYAGIAFAMTDLKPRDAYKSLVVLFYAGTVWQVLVALYGISTDTSATSEVFLSTGGERVLAGSTSMYMTGALLLALLNLEADRGARRSALHLTIAALATFALFYTFQRTTFAIVAVLVPVLLIVYRRLGSRMLALLPLCVPFLVLAALLIPRIDPDLYPTLSDRIATTPSEDTSFRFRQVASEAVWEQVREEPLLGVGFGREVVIINDQSERVTIFQDPHNQYLYLWAGGGLLLLLSFVLLLAVYLVDAQRRFRRGTAEERRLLLWAVMLWFVFVVNSASGVILTSPELLIVFWVLMTVPMAVRSGRGEEAEPA